MDYYQTLGLSRNASKEEIKEAFRSLALKFHPDRHSQSSKEVKEGATLRFKQVSEAYDVLIDDRKRADYNLRRGSSNGRTGFTGGYSYYQKPYRPRAKPSSANNWGFAFNFPVQFFTRRSFLLNVAFASILLGGAIAVEQSGEALWKMHNSGRETERERERCGVQDVKVIHKHFLSCHELITFPVVPTQALYKVLSSNWRIPVLPFRKQ